MSDLNYLDAGFDPDTDFLGADDDFDDDDEDFGADDDAAIAMLEEEDEAFLVGLIPDDQYGAAKRGRSRGVRRVGRKLRAAQRKRARAARAARSGRYPGASGAMLKAKARQQGARMKRLQRSLRRSKQKRASRGAGAAMQARQDGAGDLDFQVESPPGVGRLDRMGFLVVTPLIGNSVVGQPTVSIPAGTAANTQVVLQTPQISWAVCRIVGVEITRTINVPGAGVPDVYQLTAFSIGGGANLLLQQGNMDVSYFASGLTTKVGLRDYPILRSPNQATVTVNISNGMPAPAVTTAGNTLLGIDLIVDVLADDNFGAHLPGPYARTDALVRKPVGRR